MKKNCSILLGVCFSMFSPSAFSQWDDTRSSDWPEQCNIVSVASSIDQKVQPAYFFKSRSIIPQPLIISLHTWSGGFEQKDPLAAKCIKKDFNYIHPHFRGPNNTYEACGSELALQDIDDAISYAIQNGNVDKQNIHVIGVSGGGYATLLTYMKSKHAISTFSAWVAISNLQEWYLQSEGRKNKYGRDIAKSTTGLQFDSDDYFIDTVEARNRSPIFMKTPIEERRSSKLFIYAGIHDGYTGSVPITHSLKFYNKVAQDFGASQAGELIPENDMITMLASRNFYPLTGDSIGDRVIHYRKDYKDLLRLTIFEGTHEQLDAVALDHIPSRKIIAIGDSNGAMKGGWVDQLQTLRYSDFVYNTSIAGNTIGFDNLGRKELNSLRNIDNYLSDAEKVMHGMDAIIVMLGTNDCKAIFADSIKQSSKNLSKLIKSVKMHPVYQKYNPQLFIVTPPPIAEDDMLQAKYHGGRDRLISLLPKYKKIAKKEKCEFIDTNTMLVPKFERLTSDGIHMTEKGSILIAEKISSFIDKY